MKLVQGVWHLVSPTVLIPDPCFPLCFWLPFLVLASQKQTIFFGSIVCVFLRLIGSGTSLQAVQWVMELLVVICFSLKLIASYSALLRIP